MGPKRIIVLSIAGLAAVLALFLFRSLATGKENKPAPAPVVQAGPALIYVAVAGRDISVGDRLAESDLTWQPWPAANINPDYITNGPVPNFTGTTGVGKAASGAIAVADSVKQRALGMQGTPGEVFLGGVAKEIRWCWPRWSAPVSPASWPCGWSPACGPWPFPCPPKAPPAVSCCRVTTWTWFRCASWTAGW